MRTSKRITDQWALDVIGRPEHEIALPERLGRTLITGAAGSIGTLVLGEIHELSDSVYATDVEELDVTSAKNVHRYIGSIQPDVILHLAGAKHAPAGEEHPYDAMMVNTVGTKNVLDAARKINAKVVVASTCKACDPETAYGASKLIAERMALNDGQIVLRFYNVVETSGNVFEIWKNAEDDEPILVAADCTRKFVTAREAVSATLWACNARAGRYVIDGVISRNMGDIAETLYPNRTRIAIAPRRGDRLAEPLIASCETAIRINPWIAMVSSPHDPKEKNVGRADAS